MGNTNAGMESLADIFKKVDADQVLTKEDAVELLNIDCHAKDFYTLLSKANELSRREFGKRGYVFAQIGLNSAPCTGNCKFCSLAKDSFVVEEDTEKPLEDILNEAERAVEEKADALFLMTTADYSVERFLEVSREVKKLLPERMMFIANIGDFGDETAAKLKDTGYTGAYHIVRMNEGTDTDLPVKQRIATLDAIKKAGLELIYCVEPIGPEHTYGQIADEMLRARDYGVNVMACMKRVGVPGTPLYEKGELTDLELTKIVAATRLVTRPRQSMNVHEPNEMALLAGVNQLYAEIGVNPRDRSVETGTNRGCSISEVRAMLAQADYNTGADR